MRHGSSIAHTAPLTREMSSENHPSASRNIQLVSDHLVSCCSGGGANMGAVSYPSFPACSSFRPGKKIDKFRVTHDVSPHGNSVNDAIPPSAFSLQYESVDTAINAIMELACCTLYSMPSLNTVWCANQCSVLCFACCCATLHHLHTSSNANATMR